ncbi:cell wall-active antibiotics response protein LiaF [Bacillus salitolerans]|uniref:Cell wall-active antibiotics response protein LiaF n=1 Tax=Bacillus salitolerans TaxID=1437434 RepID=A0ABW4LXF2_9BACI
MLNKKKTDYVSTITLIAIGLLLIEVTFFNGGVMFSGFLSGLCIYYGRKKLPSTFGKILFWFGLISLFITIVTMMTFKFLLLAIIIYFVIQYLQSKQKPVKLIPIIEEANPTITGEPIIKRNPIFDNILFGQKQTPEHVYEWNDVNIHTGVGDTTIDLSNTVLPKGESVISIRNFIGNVRILVPYEMEVSVRHAVLTGSTTIFDHYEDRVFNQSLHYQTENYLEAEQKIKIITSMLIGDIEVKRV